jgi:hypothetical protein
MPLSLLSQRILPYAFLLLAKTLMKLCQQFILALLKRRPDNGDKSTRQAPYDNTMSYPNDHIPNSSQALQLLEYIVKHGSERVVDDARSHMSTVKMLRNFHYIDDKGKDQGINGKVLRCSLALYLLLNLKL